VLGLGGFSQLIILLIDSFLGVALALWSLDSLLDEIWLVVESLLGEITLSSLGDFSSATPSSYCFMI